MIHLKENFFDQNTISIDVDGVLDRGTIPVLKGVCDRHLLKNKKVILNLTGIVHITREGRGFLNGIRQAVDIINIPEFMKLGMGQHYKEGRNALWRNFSTEKRR
ncbi:MAG: hypothetical protein ABII26_06580 [Pseudomonadota bacterium]